MVGDPRKHITSCKGRWVKERRERMREGSVHSKGEAALVWCEEYHRVMAGKKGRLLQRHMCRLITEGYKTVSWWFRRYPKEFGVLRSQAGGGERLECFINCPCCGEEEEDMEHMFGGCQEGEMVSLRVGVDRWVQSLVEGLLDKWEVPWRGWSVGGVRVASLRCGLWSLVIGDY